MQFPIKIFRVEDRSMEPRIKAGDYLIVSRLSNRLKIGDVVVLKHPTKDIKIVKRISTISDTMVFVVGDNKNESGDSRNFGSMARNMVIGKVVFKI